MCASTQGKDSITTSVSLTSDEDWVRWLEKVRGILESSNSQSYRSRLSFLISFYQTPANSANIGIRQVTLLWVLPLFARPSQLSRCNVGIS